MDFKYGRPMSPEQAEALMGEGAEDPGRWRPYHYVQRISVGVNNGDHEENAITIHKQPFVLMMIAGKILGETADPATTGLYQDGQWDLSWKDEQSNYTNGPVPSDLLMGGPWAGYTIPLPNPIPFEGNKTLTFEVINRVNRVLASAEETFVIAIVLHGLADWGKLTNRP